MGISIGKCCKDSTDQKSEAEGEPKAQQIVDDEPPPITVDLDMPETDVSAPLDERDTAPGVLASAAAAEIAATDENDSVPTADAEKKDPACCDKAQPLEASPRGEVQAVTKPTKGAQKPLKLSQIVEALQKEAAPSKAKAGAAKAKPSSVIAKSASAKAKPVAGKAKAAPAKAKVKPKATATGSESEPSKTPAEGAQHDVAIAPVNTHPIRKSCEGIMYMKLRLMIISASNLKNADGMDGTGLSDPFCKVEIPGHKHVKIQTKVLDDTLDPHWNYVADICAWSPTDIFKFSVWDKDTFTADDILGRAALTGSDISKHSNSPLTLRLTETSDTAKAQISFLTVKIEILETYMSPKPLAMEVKKVSEGHQIHEHVHAWQMPKLFVTLVSARHLRNADGWLNGLSDPYCICEIPGKHESRITSPVIDDKLDPVWNYRGRVLEYEIGDSLSLAVFDRDSLSADDLLGRCKIPPDKIVNHFQGELELTDTGKKGLHSFITIKIETEENDADPFAFVE